MIFISKQPQTITLNIWIFNINVVLCQEINNSTQETNKSTQETDNSTQENHTSNQKTTAERIIEEIRKHPFTTRDLLADVIGITPDGIKKQLDKLKKTGKIRHVGATKKGHWEIIE